VSSTKSGLKIHWRQASRLGGSACTDLFNSFGLLTLLDPPG
jgi:hypothetical protein